MGQRLSACDNVKKSQFVKSGLVDFETEENFNNHRTMATARNPVRIVGLYGHNPKQNRLLASLPSEEYERLFPKLELVLMRPKMVMCEPTSGIGHVYFPTSSIVSLLQHTENGASAETAIVGNEGMVGVASFMGGGSNLTTITVNLAGYGFRLREDDLNEEFSRGGALQRVLLRYTQALILQMSQTALCNRHHSVIQQLCRLLLLSLDRLPTNELSMTHEVIASMLGVRRESVCDAAVKLQDQSVIRYSRGHITVMDRPGLESRTCECYMGVRKEYDRLLPIPEGHTH